MSKARGKNKGKGKRPKVKSMPFSHVGMLRAQIREKKKRGETT